MTRKRVAAFRREDCLSPAERDEFRSKKGGNRGGIKPEC